MSIADEILIDRYLRSELTADEAEQFETRMKDSQFADLVAEMKLVRDASIVSGQISLKAELGELEKNRPVILPPKKFFSSSKGVLIGVFLLLLISCLLLFRTCHSTPIEQELYASYFEKYPNVLDPITKSGSSDEALSISQYYELGNFDKAIAKGQSLNLIESSKSLKLKETQLGSMLYLGLSYMHVGQHEKANRVFEMIHMQDGNFRDAILYYYALSSLAIDEKEKAIELLSVLKKSEGPFASEVSKILEALDKFK